MFLLQMNTTHLILFAGVVLVLLCVAHSVAESHENVYEKVEKLKETNELRREENVEGGGMVGWRRKRRATG